MWKIRKSIDIIRRNRKSHKNVLEFLTFLFRDSACSEHDNKMADGVDEVDEVSGKHFFDEFETRK